MTHDSDEPDLSEFFLAFQIEPIDKRLYRQALMHRSYVHQKKKNRREDQQERLEFFGDAVLKFVVSYYLMHKFVTMDEGDLTKIRSQIISDRALSVVSLSMGLDRFVIVSDSEKTVNGHRRPALLSDTLEAILGAMYLDLGMDYVQEWFGEVLEQRMAHCLSVDRVGDHKTFLQEMLQKRGEALPLYECVSVSGPEHKRTFYYRVTITLNGDSRSFNGEGHSKKTAQQSAAKHCVEQLREKKVIRMQT